MTWRAPVHHVMLTIEVEVFRVISCPITSMIAMGKRLSYATSERRSRSGWSSSALQILGTDGHCLPRHRMTCNSGNEGTQCA